MGVSDAGKARSDGISHRSSWLKVPDEVPEPGRSNALARARARTRFFATTMDVATIWRPGGGLLECG